MGIRYNTYEDLGEGITRVYSANGESFLVDTWLVDDLIRPYYWSTKPKSSKTKPFTPRALINGCRVQLSRYLMGFPEGMEVDHINRDEHDNRLCNLRICSHSDNLKNLPLDPRSTTGYRGVSWDKRLRKYTAHITVNYKHKYIGQFDTPEEAYEAYCKAAVNYHGEFAPDYIKEEITC